MQVIKTIKYSLLITIIISGVCLAQITDDQKKIIDELMQKKGEKSAVARKDASIKYTSPSIYSLQDSGFYKTTEGSVPPKSLLNSAQTVDSTNLIMPIETDSLKKYGYDMFNGSPESYSPNLEATPPADYRLGPGDNILVNIWGRVDMELDLTVDRDGKVFIPKAGDIVASGLSMDQFQNRLKGALSAVYSDYSLSVTLGKIRQIRIFVYGEVNRPGGYTLSSLSTLFNALYLAGGPSARGSMRTIKHIRNNNILASVDLYQFLMKGDNKQDIRLESGDVVFVPIVGPLVKIAGQVNRPAIYEIMGGETVDDLIALGGGSTADALLKKISIERIGKDDNRLIQNIDLTISQPRSDSLTILHDGDYVTVPSICDLKKNTVSITGNVKHPGIYGLRDSMRVMDIIDEGKQIKNDSYLKRANLFRTMDDRSRRLLPINLEEVFNGVDSTNYYLMDNDSLVIYSQNEIRRKSIVSISGAVKNPGKYEYFENMKLSDLIFLSGNPLRQSYLLQAEIARINPGKPAHILYANLEAVLNESDTTSDISLNEDDNVYIRTIPGWKLEEKVTVDGEVMFPGQYTISKEDEKLTDILARCGGFTANAFPQGLVFVRGSIQSDLDKRRVRSLLASTEPIVLDSLDQPIPQSKVEIDLTRVNRIVVDINEITKNPDSPENIKIQSGDYIYIPGAPSGIHVIGAVASNGTIAYRNGKKADYFVKSAGGFSINADKGQTRLIKANGIVFSGNKALQSKVESGDMIVVPEKITREKQWLKSTTALVTIISSIVTTALIVDRLK